MGAVRHCINCVCSRDNKGPRPKDDSLGASTRTFWNKHFSRAYPDLLDGKGLSVLKELLAQQMIDCILTDAKTRFQSRLARLIHFLLIFKQTRFLATLVEFAIVFQSLCRQTMAMHINGYHNKTDTR